MCSTVAVALAAFSAVLAADAAADAEGEEDTLGRGAMAQWVIDGRARGVMAVVNRTGPGVEDGEEGEVEDEEEALAGPATITRGFLIRVDRDGTKGPGMLLRESITTRLAFSLARRVFHASWTVFWLSKATKVIGWWTRGLLNMRLRTSRRVFLWEPILTLAMSTL